MFQILIVDDDKNLKRAISLLLTDSGYRTFSAGSSREALHTLEKCRIDLMVLEAALPGMDGLALTKLLRDCKNDLPILMLSSRKQPADIKKGFLAGVDDYVTKPFDSEELTLRIKALLRRAKIVSEHQLVIGKTTLDYDTFSVTTDGREQILPQKEFCLLYKLLSYPNRYLPACSSWMTSGAPPPSPPPPPSASTSTASETASAMQKTSPSSPSAASAIRHR